MNVIMPQLGETVAEGTVANWHKKVGDRVAADELLFDVETDKVSMEVPAPAAGVITKILVPAGTTVDVGTVLAVIESGDAAAVQAQPAAAEDAPPSTGSAADQPTRRGSNDGRPVMRAVASDRLAEARAAQRPDAFVARRTAPRRRISARSRGRSGLGPQRAHHTPRRHRLHRGHADEAQAAPGVAAAEPAVASAPATAPAPAARAPTPATGPAPAGQALPFTRIRRLTAEHMVRSKATSPHVLQAVEVDFQRVDQSAQDGARRLEGEARPLDHVSAVHRARGLRSVARLSELELERPRRRARDPPST